MSSDTLFTIQWKDRTYLKRYRLNEGQGLQLVDSVDFGTYPEFKNCNLSFVIGKRGLLYKYPYLYFQYSHSKNDNYLDDKAFARFNVVDKSLTKIINYPSCYYCSYIYLATGNIAVSGNAEPVVLFDYYDALIPETKQGYIEYPLRHSVSRPCAMFGYDESKKGNIAYVRRYLNKNELNMALIPTKQGNWVALQRLARNSFYEKPVYQVYVFNNSFKQLSVDTIHYKLSHDPFIAPYKDGFITINDSLNKIIYYEIRN